MTLKLGVLVIVFVFAFLVVNQIVTSEPATLGMTNQKNKDTELDGRSASRFSQRFNQLAHQLLHLLRAAYTLRAFR